MDKKFITFVITAIVFGAMGFFSAKYVDIKSIIKEKGVSLSTTDNFQAGWEAAQKRLVELGFYPLSEGVITTINGQVVDMKDNKITVKIIPFEPLGDPDLDSRIAEVDSLTKIYLSFPKDQAEYERELVEYDKLIEKQMNTKEEEAEELNPPEQFIKKEISIKDIRNGQEITILSREEDIRNKKQFMASEITAQFIEEETTP